LTELGRRQAAATGARIARSWSFAKIYCSPLGRCRETARAIAAPSGAEIQVLDGLNDLDYGAWQWKTFEAVRAASPELFHRWFAAPDRVRFPGGESLQDLAARTADALREVTDRHPDETVVMVGHDSVNRAVLMQALAQPLLAYWRVAQSPCGLSEIEIGDGQVRVVRVNETAHLDSL
jgi:probable phosphoglycerate mutase